MTTTISLGETCKVEGAISTYADDLISLTLTEGDDVTLILDKRIASAICKVLQNCLEIEDGH